MQPQKLLALQYKNNSALGQSMSSLEGNLRVIESSAPSKDFQAEGHWVSKIVGPLGINGGYPVLLAFGVTDSNKSPPLSLKDQKESLRSYN